MIDHQKSLFVPTEEIAPQESAPVPTQPATPSATVAPEHTESSTGVAEEPWQSRAGREGARRIHQLIQEGRLYEQEHGLKRGRQRIRQLIELGKLYEQEHGLRPAHSKTHRRRLSHLGRQELMATLLECLVRIAKPSFRAELTQLVETLGQPSN
jgi:hypothetical protein